MRSSQSPVPRCQIPMARRSLAPPRRASRLVGRVSSRAGREFQVSRFKFQGWSGASNLKLKTSNSDTARRSLAPPVSAALMEGRVPSPGGVEDAPRGGTRPTARPTRIGGPCPDTPWRWMQDSGLFPRPESGGVDGFHEGAPIPDMGVGSGVGTRRIGV